MTNFIVERELLIWIQSIFTVLNLEETSPFLHNVSTYFIQWLISVDLNRLIKLKFN